MNRCPTHLLDHIIEGTPEACDLCRPQAARLNASLELFRNAMDRWSAREFRPSPDPATFPTPHRALHWARWAVAFAVLVMAAIIPIYRHEQAQRRLADSRADAELLQQVETDLSQDVSPSMEPLLKMAAWDAPSNPAAVTQSEPDKAGRKH